MFAKAKSSKSFDNNSESLEDKADDLGQKFCQFVRANAHYGKIYGANNEYFKVGIQNGLDDNDLYMIKKKLGYSLYSVNVGNEHFIDVTFKKSK